MSDLNLATRLACLLIVFTGLIIGLSSSFSGSHAASNQPASSNQSKVTDYSVSTQEGRSPSSTHVLAEPDEQEQARISEAYGKLPLSFEANQGQADSPVKFISRGSGYSLFLTSNEAVLSLSTSAAPESDSREADAQRASNAKQAPRATATLRMTLEGANPFPQVTGLERQPGKTSYFIGNDSKQWRTQIESYTQVKYREVYPGIDLVYYGNQRQLEYDFIVAPGANPDSIHLTFNGADKILIDTDGALVLRTPAGDVRQHQPVIYQELSGGRREIKGRYLLKRGQEVGFEIGEYDRTRPLIIDPVMVYSTYLGGNGDDKSYSIAVDSSGSAYIVGRTTSTDFPPPGSNQTASGYSDAFVVKLNPTGTAILSATYLGGTRDETAFSTAIDADGNVYVMGSTTSQDFPTKNALQATLRGSNDLFVTKLNTELSAITYSTYLGGSNSDIGYGIAVDAGGNAYLTGYTFSTDFPLVNALQDAKSGEAVFKSTDSGSNWNPSSKGLGAAQVSAFAIAPVTPSTVYAATDTGVYKSTDSGSNWSATGPFSLLSSSYISTDQSPVSDIVIDPINPSTLYVSTCDGVYKTVDGGDHWVAINNGLVDEDYKMVSHLVLDPSNPLTIYAGLYFGSHTIYKTIDGGATWSPSDTNLNPYNDIVFDLEIDPANPSILYAASNGVFYKSTNSAQTWQSFGYLTFNGGSPYDIAIDPTNPSTLYVGTDTGIWKSTNGGVGMTRLDGSPYYAPSVIVDPNNPSIIYAATGDLTIAKSTDGGNTWTTAGIGFAQEFFQHYRTVLAFDPANTNRLYAGGYSGSDAFLTKLDAAGTQLLYSTYVGGASNETSTGVAVDASGNAYLAGFTDSVNFPVANAVQTSHRGGRDGYVAKINVAGSAFVYSTYLGGQYDDSVNDVATDSAGNAYVTGYTESADFPTLNSMRQPTCVNCPPNYISADAFVTKLNPLGSAFVYSTFLGGNDEDYGKGITVDAAGNAYVIGDTKSTDFLVFSARQTIKGLGQREDVFVSALDGAGSTLLYSTYLGGNHFDLGEDIALGPDSSAYITGRTFSPNFPTVNPIQATKKPGSGNDTFIAKLGPETSNGARADLSITQTDSPDPAAEGQLITYTLTVTNNGPSPATGIVVNDPAQFFDVSYTSGTTDNGGQCSMDGFGHTITCSVGDLAVGAQATVTIKLTHNWYGSPTTIRNTVVVGSNVPDPNLSNNSVTAETTVKKALSIEGMVRNSAGAALKGATLTLSGTRSASATTNDQGYYAFHSLPEGGSYTVTPSLTNYTFNPPTRTFDNLSANQTSDFTATLLALSISGATITEGDTGTKNAVFTVTLSAPTSQVVTVGYSTSALNATSGTDYQPVSGTLTFNPAVTTQTINVPVIGDVLDEFDESFQVSLNNPTNAVLSQTSAQGTITDDDPTPTVSVDDVSVMEGNSGQTIATFTLRLSAASGRSGLVQVETSDGTATGTATGGNDYRSLVGSVTQGTGPFLISFGPGQTTAQISVQINGDATYEPDETFFLNLVSATNITITDNQGLGTILNDDALPSTISIANISVNEGNAGTSVAVFTVTLSAPRALPVTVAYATADGTANAITSTPGDYFASTGNTLTFNPGETTKTISIMINGDVTVEPDETFMVNLSNPVNATLANSVGTGTILNDDVAISTLQFASAATFAVRETDSTASIVVERVNGTSGSVTVEYATSDGTATAGTDYTQTSGTLTFANGELAKAFTIPILDDNLYEGEETLRVRLSNPTGNVVLSALPIASLTIVENDLPPPALQLSEASYNATESIGSIAVIVNRSGNAALPLTVNYATADAANFLQNCNVINGAATSRCDYVGVLGTLHFAAGETSKTISIPIVDDTYLEGPEGFSISLSNPTGGAVLGANRTATITIADSGTDSTGQSNPIDDQNFFVRQHYIDFLSREPDPLSAGWITILNGCGRGDQACQLSVSQGIYGSPEFRERGYFIYKFFSVALGRKPSYDEFNVDRARVSGFQTEAELQQSKVDFIKDFMARPEFANAYSGLSDNAYVQQLFDTAGVTQVTTPGGVLNAVAMQLSMISANKTRAQVLREVAESPEVSARFLTESTVVMHYFGYLRRDPDAAYQDWINILNSSGDSREVTRGFINSAEYRARFGQ